MFSTYQKIALVAAGLAPSVSGLIQMQVRYSDNMIDGETSLETAWCFWFQREDNRITN